MHPVNHHIEKLNQQISIYQQLTEALIYEKKELSTERKAQKKEKIYKLAKTILEIQGDSDLEKKIDGYIENISSLKAGRKLIKELAKKSDKIMIKQGTAFFCTHLTIQVGSNERTDYNTINSQFQKCQFQRPSWVDFAHELIHALHHSYPDKFRNYWSIRNDILPGMDDLNEQHVIAGFNPRHFSKRPTLEPIEVLSENVFLLALNLPPRIDHQKATGPKLENSSLVDPDNTNIYFSWLAKELNAINQIPIDKSDDVEYVLKFVTEYPSAIQSLPEKFSDQAFMLRLIKIQLDFLKNFPSLCNDAGFMLKAASINSIAVFYSSPELLKNKEFILKAAPFLEGDKIWQNAFFDIIDPSLRNDPEIKQVL